MSRAVHHSRWKRRPERDALTFFVELGSAILAFSRKDRAIADSMKSSMIWFCRVYLVVVSVLIV